MRHILRGGTGSAKAGGGNPVLARHILKMCNITRKFIWKYDGSNPRFENDSMNTKINSNAGFTVSREQYFFISITKKVLSSKFIETL